MPSSILTIEKFIIPPVGLHIHIKIFLNNKVARFVVDTGASQTVIDKNRAEHFIPGGIHRMLDALTAGIGTNNLESQAVIIKNIRIGELKIKNYELILLDLQHVNESYKTMGFKEIDGILGSELLDKYSAIIDFKKAQLKLSWK